MPDKMLYSINEGAAELAISRSTLYLLIGAGDVSVVKLGHRTLIPRSSLTDYVARLTDSSPAVASVTSIAS